MQDARRWAACIDDLGRFILAGARKVRAPTLLIRGASSDVVSEETVAEFIENVPHATVVDVTSAGHMFAGDSNHMFTGAVLDLLRRTRMTA